MPDSNDRNTDDLVRRITESVSSNIRQAVNDMLLGKFSPQPSNQPQIYREPVTMETRNGPVREPWRPTSAPSSQVNPFPRLAPAIFRPDFDYNVPRDEVDEYVNPSRMPTMPRRPARVLPARADTRAGSGNLTDGKFSLDGFSQALSSLSPDDQAAAIRLLGEGIVGPDGRIEASASVLGHATRVMRTMQQRARSMFRRGQDVERDPETGEYRPTIEAQYLRGQINSLAQIMGAISGADGMEDVRRSSLLADPSSVDAEAMRRFLDSGHGVEKLAHQIAGGRVSGSVQYQHTASEQALRTQLQQARAMSKLTGGARLPEEMRTYFTSQKEFLTAEVKELLEEIGKVGPDNPQEATRMGEALSSKSVIIKSIESILRETGEETHKGLSRVVDVVTKGISMLGLGSLASKFLVQDPYRYGTVPAIQALSQQGDLGNLLGGALGESEAYRQELKSHLFNAGLGVGMAGLASMRTPGGGTAGRLMLAAGGLLGTLGLTDLGPDMLQGLGIATKPEEIMGANIAQKLMDPQRILTGFQAGRSGLLAMNSMDGEFVGDYGFYYNDEAAKRFTSGHSTGNVHTDLMISRYRGLTTMGYTRDDLLGLSSEAAHTLTGRSGISILDATGLSAQVAGAYGLDPSTTLGMLGMLQRTGARDPRESLLQAMGVAGVGMGGDASDSFLVGQITAAILQAGESLKLQNISRSATHIQEDVARLYTVIASSDSEMGEMIKNNPELLGSLTSTFDSAIKRSLSDSTSMGLDLSLGSSIREIIEGDHDVMYRRMGFITGLPMAQGIDFSDEDSVYQSWPALSLLLQAADLTGIQDLQKVRELLGIFQNTDMTADEKAMAMSEFSKSAEEDLDEKIANFVDSKAGDLLRSLTHQTNSLIVASQATLESIQSMNNAVRVSVTSGRLMEMAEAGVRELLEKLRRLLGVHEDSDPAEVAGNIDQFLQENVGTDYTFDDIWEQGLSRYAGPEGEFSPRAIRRIVQEAKESEEKGEGAQEFLQRLRNDGGGESFTIPGITPESGTSSAPGASQSSPTGIARPTRRTPTITADGEVVNVTMSISGITTEALQRKINEQVEAYVVRQRMNHV